MTLSRTICLLLLAAPMPDLQAAAPIEREVQSTRSVQVYGTNGQRVRQPIGAIDFSASGSSARRFGPWDVEADAFRNVDGVIFYDDGATGGSGSNARYRRPDGSRCETLGNVTVCR